MSFNSSVNEKQDFLDAKTIPKFQFKLVDDQLIKCMKQVYVKTIQQDNKIKQQKIQSQLKLYTKEYMQSLKLLSTNLTFPSELQNLVSPSASLRDKNNKKVQNEVLSESFKLCSKFNLFSQILSALYSKMMTIQKRITLSEQKTTKNVKQRTQSIQQQLMSFIKDYKTSFKDMNIRMDQEKFQQESRIKNVQTNTIWKINQCYKRLQDRPNIEMVKNNVEQVEIKLIKMIELGISRGGDKGSIQILGKLEKDMIKLQKKLNFNFIEIENQIKALNDKMKHQYLSIENYSNEKIDMIKKLQNFMVFQNEVNRKIKFMEGDSDQNKKYRVKNQENITKIYQNLDKLNQSVKKFTKTDEFAKIMQKIDPHQLCKLSNIVKNLQDQDNNLINKINDLQRHIEAIRSTTSFWNIANSNPEQSSNKKIHPELIQKMIKDELNNSQLKSKLNKFQHQIIDLSSLKEGINDILKKLAKVNKDQDLTNIKYEIKGVQEYLKRQILIVTNRINSIEVTLNGLNEAKKRPRSALGRNDDKIMTSFSAKKLVPVACLSCHQTNNFLTQKKIYKSRLEK